MKLDTEKIDRKAIKEFLLTWELEDCVSVDDVVEFCERRLWGCDEWPEDDYADFPFTSKQWGSWCFTVAFTYCGDRQIALYPQAYKHICLDMDTVIYRQIDENEEPPKEEVKPDKEETKPDIEEEIMGFWASLDKTGKMRRWDAIADKGRCLMYMDEMDDECRDCVKERPFFDPDDQVCWTDGRIAVSFPTMDAALKRLATEEEIDTMARDAFCIDRWLKGTMFSRIDDTQMIGLGRYVFTRSQEHLRNGWYSCIRAYKRVDEHKLEKMAEALFRGRREIEFQMTAMFESPLPWREMCLMALDVFWRFAELPDYPEGFDKMPEFGKIENKKEE